MMGWTAYDAGSSGTASFSTAEVQTFFDEAARLSANAALEVMEILELEANYYAVVTDRESVAAVAEWVLDKSTGTVSSEMGPNMMWHRTRDMGYGAGAAGEAPVPVATGNDLGEEAAARIADVWLEDHVPGARVDMRADSFLGYYTFHILEGDAMKGLLSVPGESGHVWYHTWHGEFIRQVDQDANAGQRTR